MATTFAWDVHKAEANQRKHGVSFAEAVEALCDPLLLTAADYRHPAQELRFVSVGETRAGRVLTVGHTDEKDVVRVITARTATRSEPKTYEYEG